MMTPRASRYFRRCSSRAHWEERHFVYFTLNNPTRREFYWIWRDMCEQMAQARLRYLNLKANKSARNREERMRSLRFFAHQVARRTEWMEDYVDERGQEDWITGEMCDLFRAAYFTEFD